MSTRPVADLFAEVRDDLRQVEEQLYALLEGEDPDLQELATHLLRGGGKRLRPALVLLSAKMFRYHPVRVIPVAAAVELIHMATLVHDDVVDGATLRRGVPTVNARWGSRTSVLLGDFLFARAFSTLAATGDNRVVQIMADVVLRMSQGELQQLGAAFDLGRSEEEYLDQIDKKTATFIGECCRLGALLGEAGEDQVEALRRFGYCIGMGFQIVDDILDLAGDERELGKPRGTDLRSGVLTLPVLHALRQEGRSGPIRRRLEAGPPGNGAVEEIARLVGLSGSFEYAYARARAYIDQARGWLARLPAGPIRDRLDAIAEFVGTRRF